MIDIPRAVARLSRTDRSGDFYFPSMLRSGLLTATVETEQECEECSESMVSYCCPGRAAPSLGPTRGAGVPSVASAPVS